MALPEACIVQQEDVAPLEPAKDSGTTVPGSSTLSW